MMPLLVMRVLGDYPGVPGMFIAGVFSASLSTLSTGLNSLAAVALEDFFKHAFPNLSEAATGHIMRVSIIVFGFISVASVYLVDKLGNVVALSSALNGTVNGPLLGLFIIGLFIPRVRAKVTNANVIQFQIKFTYVFFYHYFSQHSMAASSARQ